MRTWTKATARLGVRTPEGRDTLAAAALIALSLARLVPAIRNGLLTLFPVWAVGVAYLLATVDLGTIAVRRRRPVLALAVATVIPLLGATLPTRPAFLGVGVVVCAYTVATLLSQTRATLVIGACAAVHVLGGLAITAAGGEHGGLLTFWGVTPGDTTGMVAAAAAAYFLPATAGFYVQARRAAVTRRAAQIAREREERAKAAVMEERTRIARELHDIAAHDLSAIVVQAGAADRLLDRDPAAARATLRAIRAQGRDTLTSLRALVGIMRDDGPDDRAPTLARMEDTIRRSQATGMTVDTETSGEPRPLPVTIDLAASRLLQEALTNARLHAPGAPVTVTTAFHDGSLQMTIRNRAPAHPATSSTSGSSATSVSASSATPASSSGAIPGSGSRSGGGSGHGSGSGYGLLGMRERVHHAGGTLTVGPQPDGGWLVSATFPTEQT
ncbi:sensor histidine kinase [Nonomuraea rhizosphaerae]|uniref:sensor histidine kinase n=1 Tax=Nonomuraea rhizosphaerae TaxID=2665663 RepID=UPI001C5F614D|nr:histidine kinase [Nonomuraea rhizosphaerae]